eukprot:10154561-Prorocentrum_lima.AAC.1
MSSPASARTALRDAFADSKRQLHHPQDRFHQPRDAVHARATERQREGHDVHQHADQHQGQQQQAEDAAKE